MTRTYLRLPINADEGLPQAFRLDLGGRVYRVLLYVNVPEEEVEPPPDAVYDLFSDDPTQRRGAFLVMRVSREGPAAPEVIFQRKLQPDVEYTAAELTFTFREAVVDRRNLNGAGAFGSHILGGVATRWAS